MLGLVQRGLEKLYRIETDLDVADFVVDEAGRDALGPAVNKAPREQLLVREDEGELCLALYVDPAALANLALHDPRGGLGAHNLGDFLLAIEGVSHFVKLAWRARQGRPVTALELELQAEIDKYVTCLLTTGADLRERLYRGFSLVPGMSDGERERYIVANENAAAYADTLHARFVAEDRVPDMLGELRHFYRLGLAEKLAFIRAA